MRTPEHGTPIQDLLKQQCALPQDAEAERIVMWKVFRSLAEALEYPRHIMLGADQSLVGGHSQDSAGDLWWVGVKVANLETWGNSQAIQLRDPYDANDPQGQGRGLSS